MQNPFIIRPADPGDIPACASLLSELFAIEQDFTADREKQIRGLTLLLSSQSACLFVAEDVSGIAGMVSVQLVISTSEGGYSAWVEDLYVVPAKRRRGIARALLAEVKKWGREKQVKRFQLAADKNNYYAVAWYRKLGWQVLHLEVLRKYP